MVLKYARDGASIDLYKQIPGGMQILIINLRTLLFESINAASQNDLVQSKLGGHRDVPSSFNIPPQRSQILCPLSLDNPVLRV